ncbi:restriction endonuclease subunit S [Chryseobacterium sp. S0630]|uniref:restriction endonuclease subunit S n=1 Tax=Chryseobacterium sp. S0630 TaxID=2957803 RepID=UPI0020A18B3E|nr:restriction endonuclease subunit S [Chryseobacterium sp. S0630]MCP1299433.1 restriction endonuclease subunit S [Chryseobacterium sp. S0630]
MSYKRLGNYITLIDNRNRDLSDYPLLGVSVQKRFIPSIANIIGSDMSKYKIIEKNNFTYIADTSRRGDKIGIALLKEFEKAIVSQAYTSFKIIDENELSPDYLMMWFSRPEFDRYARYHSIGSVREVFDWKDMCDVELPIPSIEEQNEIVAQYQSIENKIKVNEQICEKLEATAQALYKHWFVDFEFPDENGKPYKSSGGKMVWNEELGKEIPEGWGTDLLKNYCSIKGGKRLPKDNELNNYQEGRPYIRVADMNKNKFIALNSKFQYINDEIQKFISKYIVAKDNVLISIVGTIGLVNIIHKSLHQANLTENCFKLTNFKIINSDYLYHFLTSNDGQREIEMKTVGGVQAKLPMYNVELLDLMIPSENILKHFKAICIKLNDLLLNKKLELDRLTQLQSLLLSQLSVGGKVENVL